MRDFGVLGVLRASHTNPLHLHYISCNWAFKTLFLFTLELLCFTPARKSIEQAPHIAQLGARKQCYLLHFSYLSSEGTCYLLHRSYNALLFTALSYFSIPQRANPRQGHRISWNWALEDTAIYCTLRANPLHKQHI